MTKNALDTKGLIERLGQESLSEDQVRVIGFALAHPDGLTEVMAVIERRNQLQTALALGLPERVEQIDEPYFSALQAVVSRVTSDMKALQGRYVAAETDAKRKGWIEARFNSFVQGNQNFLQLMGVPGNRTKLVQAIFRKDTPSEAILRKNFVNNVLLGYLWTPFNELHRLRFYVEGGVCGEEARQGLTEPLCQAENTFRAIFTGHQLTPHRLHLGGQCPPGEEEKIEYRGAITYESIPSVVAAVKDLFSQKPPTDGCFLDVSWLGRDSTNPELTPTKTSVVVIDTKHPPDFLRE